MNLSEPMRLALVRRLAVNAHTVDALMARDMISAAQRRATKRAQYDLTFTDQGESYADWLRRLGIS